MEERISLPVWVRSDKALGSVAWKIGRSVESLPIRSGQRSLSAEVLLNVWAVLLPSSLHASFLALPGLVQTCKQGLCHLPQLDWAAFGVMTLPSIGIPLLLWYSSKRKYDTPKSKKN